MVVTYLHHHAVCLHARAVSASEDDLVVAGEERPELMIRELMLVGMSSSDETPESTDRRQYGPGERGRRWWW